jgi:hypothetical protein
MKKVLRNVVLTASVVLFGAGSLHAMQAPTGTDPVPHKTSPSVIEASILTFLTMFGF